SMQEVDQATTQLKDTAGELARMVKEFTT
ncbi:MAG: hypothetical protein ACJA0N_001191, partial [Pseudohongiellaceae bacterium]